MNYIIQLTNKKTGQIITKEVNDLNEGEKLYFKFVIDTSELEDGEYDLELTQSGQLILTDVLYVGDYHPNSLQYKRGENTFIEIILDAKFQEDKEVEIIDKTTIITTDEGYDGLKSVMVNATPLYDIAFNEGFESGGKTQKELLETIEVTENGTYTKEDGYNEVIVNVPDLNGSYDDGYETGYADGKEDGKSDQKALLTDITINKNGIYTKEDGYNKITVDVGVVKTVPNGITFRDNTSTEIPSDVWTKNDWSNVYYCEEMFYNNKNLTNLNIDDFSKIGLKPFGSLLRMFCNCQNLTDIPFMDTSEVFNMSNMFYGCFLIQTIPPIDTSNVTDMEAMFQSCESIQTISPINTSNVTDMNSMFSNCYKLQTIPPIDVSNVTNIYGMFKECTLLEEVTFVGNPSKVNNTSDVFKNVKAITFYYDNRYDYNKIIALLPAGSTAIPITVE